jgi:hypothetical protein
VRYPTAVESHFERPGPIGGWRGVDVQEIGSQAGSSKLADLRGHGLQRIGGALEEDDKKHLWHRLAKHFDLISCM